MPVTLTIPQVIARLQREMAGDKMVMRICDEMLRHLYKPTTEQMRETTLRAAITAVSHADNIQEAICILEDMRNTP